MKNPDYAEPILDSELPIIDSHHHLWFQPEAVVAALEAQDTLFARKFAPTFRCQARYLFDEFHADITSGHRVIGSVHVNARAMYRTKGPEALKSVGEVEFVNGVAAMAASGSFGESRICAGIVGGVDLMLGEAVEQVLVAHLQAGGGRYRGVRSRIVFDEDANLMGADAGKPQVLRDPMFRRGFSRLRALNLSFDAWLLEPQLPELIELAHTFPDTQIILDHVGAPVGIGRYSGQRELRFPIWLENIRALSRCPNVAVKLGGLGIPFGGFASYGANPRFNSEQLAAEWRPYIEICIECFGVDRCMFESNFPVDAAVASYPVLWNAFKRSVAGASQAEKMELFSATAARIYRLDLPGVAS